MKRQNNAACVLPASAESILALARQDLSCYAMANFPSFELPPHLDLVISKLEAVERGDIKRLILSLPPRHGKSLAASTYFPAWCLGRHPDWYVIAASYGQELADDFGRRVRNTVHSPTHRSIFPKSRVAEDSAAIHRFNLTAGGAYYAVGRGASVTGRGAHLLLIDDPLKDMEEANSPTIRRSLQQWFSTVAYTRLMPDAAVLVISTRWNEDDLTGWILREFASEGWEYLNLPAIAETSDPISRPEGAALWPNRYPLEVLESIRRQIGSAAFASLYQGRPAPIEGRLFKREWWRFYTAPPASFTRIVMSIDSAFKTGQENDYTAITIWGETRSDGYFLLHAWRGRVEFPELKKKVKDFAQSWSPNAVLVEDKASGQSLIQELKRDTNLPIVPVKVDKDKVTRASAVTAIVEAGKVLLPASAGWLDEYVDELSTFPAAAHDDFVDSTTQALGYFGRATPGENQLEALRRLSEGSQAPGRAAAGTARGPRAVPRISTISPAAWSTAGGHVVTITGESFEEASVAVDGQLVSTTVVDPNSLSFVALPHAPGQADLTVTTLGGTVRAVARFIPGPFAQDGR